MYNAVIVLIYILLVPGFLTINRSHSHLGPIYLNWRLAGTPEIHPSIDIKLYLLNQIKRKLDTSNSLSSYQTNEASLLIPPKDAKKPKESVSRKIRTKEKRCRLVILYKNGRLSLSTFMPDKKVLTIYDKKLKNRKSFNTFEFYKHSILKFKGKEGIIDHYQLTGYNKAQEFWRAQWLTALKRVILKLEIDNQNHRCLLNLAKHLLDEDSNSYFEKYSHRTFKALVIEEIKLNIQQIKYIETNEPKKIKGLGLEKYKKAEFKGDMFIGDVRSLIYELKTKFTKKILEHLSKTMEAIEGEETKSKHFMYLRRNGDYIFQLVFIRKIQRERYGVYVLSNRKDHDPLIWISDPSNGTLHRYSQLILETVALKFGIKNKLLEKFFMKMPLIAY